MSSEPFIVRLEIEGFRGFRDQAVFEFSGSAVVLAGPNGTGKTSFFDAVQWLFTGDLDRLLPYRARRNSEHVVNSYHSPEPARVTCWLNRAGDEMRATRSGNYESSTFEVSQGGVSSFGPDAESRLRSFVCASDDARIEVLLRNSGIMQQDVMRSVLEAHPATRHEYVSELLGLGALEGFQASVTDAAKALKDRSRVAKDELEAAEQSLARAKQSAQAVIDATAQDAAVEQAREALVSALRELPAKPSWRSHQPPSATVLIAELLRLRALLDRLGQSRESIDRREAMPGLDVLVASVRDREAVVEQLVEQLHAAETILAERTEVLESARSHSAAFDRLAALALEFLADDCPVCEQPIDPAAVAERLTLRSGESADLEAQRLAQIEAEATAGALRSQLAAAQAALNGDRQLLEERQGLERNWLELQRELVDIRDTAQYVSIEPESIEDAVATDWTAMRSSLAKLSALAKQLQSLERSAADSATLDRLHAETDSAQELADRARERFLALDARAESIAVLSKQVADGRTAVTERRFEAIQPLVADIYSRLDPHPTFKTLQFDHALYRSKPTTTAIVRDSVESIEAEPLLIFSSSQANIVALSYFLAVGMAAGERGLPFVMLDDPLQSMDDVNVLGFADLCRYLRLDRQLFLSTHDRRFASLLERKLATRGDENVTEVVDFWGWDRSGPTFTQRTIAPLPAESIPYPLVRS